MVKNSANDLTPNGIPVTAPVAMSAIVSISFFVSLGIKFLGFNLSKNPLLGSALLSNNNFSSSVISSNLPSAIFYCILLFLPMR